MSKTPVTPPSPVPFREEDLLIAIDPELIEEALASVERSTRHAAAPASVEEIEVSVEVSDTPPPVPPAAADDPARQRLEGRVRDQAAAIRRLESELARATEARDANEKQARDLRQALHDQGVDFERFRARARKDVEEAERRGEERVLRPLADVYDNVERAWLHAVSDPAQILGGLQMIVEQFKRLLARVGFERIEAERGRLFDPEIHEAVLHVQDDQVLPGTIVHEVHAGFRLRGRLFRPARVTVSAPPPGLGS